MLINLINNIAFLIALVAAGQMVVSRFREKTLNRQALLGVLFGGVVLLGMANPVNFSPGVFFDGRSIVLAAAGVVGGGVTAAIAAGMAAFYRYQLGGSGAPVGIMIVLLSALFGVLARQWWLRRTQPPRPIDYLALGVVVQLMQLAIFTQVPNRAGYAFIEQAWWMLLLFYPPATMLLCLIFHNYEQQLIDKESLQSAHAAVVAEERASMQRFHAYFDHSIVGLAITSLEKGWIEVNDALCTALGYTRDELTRMTWTELTYPEDLAPDMAQFNRMLAGEINGYAMDKRFIHKDGHLVDTRLAVSHVRKPDGSLDYVVAMVEDITERKQNELELQRLYQHQATVTQQLLIQQQRLEKISYNVPGVLYQFQRWPDGRSAFPYASTGIVAIYGVAPEDVREDATPVFALLHPDDLAQVSQSIDKSASTLSPWHDAYRVVLPGGKIIWVEGEATPERMSDGSLLWHGYIRDVTERKAAEAELDTYRHHLEDLVTTRTAELATAKDAAEAASRAKSTFLANMSHELRTPMNGVMGMIELAHNRMADPKGLAQLDKAKASADHLLHVINDILDISKIEAERLSLEVVPFAFGEVLANVPRVLGQSAAQKQIDLLTDLAPEVTHKRFLGDPMRLGQILLNLTGNALKFTDQGAITLRARLVEDHPGSVLLRWEVVDTGIGIAAEDQQRLFTAFEQADNSMTRKYGGTGLGLAISKRLVEMMGGEIGVKSMPGEGSTFWFTVRLGKTADAILPAPTFTGKTAAARLLDEYAGTRILLAEDEPINQEVSRGLLEDAGFVVDLADDGLQALAMAKQKCYALILMDMQMPRMNGVEATQAIRNRADSLNQTTPILAMTANAYDEDREACLAAGMNEHISKPVDPQKLYETLLAWLKRRGE